MRVSIVCFSACLALASFGPLVASPNTGSVLFSDDVPVGTGLLRGQVRWSGGEALPGLTVRVKGSIRVTSTDEAGFFQFRGLSEGTYVVAVSGVGVVPLEQAVRVGRGEAATLDFSVEPSVEQLAELKVGAARGPAIRETLPDVTNTAIYAGKKSEVISLAALDANLATNSTRQVFSKTPGVMVWENDGSGVQVGVSVRGLSPNRSWEFNVRQNGTDISSDPFGYPEAYYNPPMEAVDRIELVRGGASLQFGPQFGGLLNYVLKPASATKPFSLETQQTVGSYGLFSTYNRVSGTVGRFQYNAYAHYRQGNGWRENSQYAIFNGFASVSYLVSNRLRLGLEVSQMTNESQQAGGLTDAQFQQDARRSSRARNWLSTPWTVPTLTAEYVFSDKSRLTATLHGLLGERNSIGFVQPITVADAPTATGQLANRQLDRDRYRNWGSELRYVTRFVAGGQTHALATGLKYFNGHTQRRQQGRGDAGSDYNLTLQTDRFPRDLSLGVTNAAAFAEVLLRPHRRWSVTPGIRLESLSNAIGGRLSVAANGTDNVVSQQSSRRFALAGIGTELKLTDHITLYGNASQAYRPVLFSDLTPAAVTDFVVDPNLRDARGYTLDAGVRGRVGNFLTADVGLFYVNYNDRIGTLTLLNEQGRTYQLRTNIGRSVSRGAEVYLELDPIAALWGRSRVGYVRVFSSLGFTDARYQSLRVATVANGQATETNLSDRVVENAPAFIGRFGATYALKSFTITALLNRVGRAYSDANNTETPTANAQNGVVPAYQVLDLAASWTLKKRYTFRAGLNNLTDARYFTRRAGGYPGPGILPAESRNGFVSVGFTL